jgi:hypothetical protein
VLGDHAPHGAGGRAHHHRLGHDHVLAELDPTQHGAGRHPGGGEQAVAFHHVLDLIFLLGVLNAHFQGALAQGFSIDDEPGLHLAADAAQGRRRQHALRRAAAAEIDIDAGLRLGAMDHAGNVAVADQADRGAELADRGDLVGVARAVEQDGGDFRRLDAFGLGQPDDVFFRRRVEVDGALRIAGADGDLVHVAVGRVQQRTAIGHRDCGDRARHVLGAQGRAFERIDRNVDLGSVLVADLLANEQHWRLVDLALADHHRAVDRQFVQLATHGVDRGLVGGLLLPAPAQPRRRYRRALGHAYDLEGENALQQQFGLDGDRCHFLSSP